MKKATTKHSKSSTPARGVTFLPSPSAQTHSHNSLSTSMPHVAPLSAPRAGTLLAFKNNNIISLLINNNILLLFKSKSMFIISLINKAYNKAYNVIISLKDNIIIIAYKIKRLLLLMSKSLYNDINL